jgi:hypothetical protein
MAAAARFPRLRRLLFVLACLQVLSPAYAAISDAWRLDRREAYAHVESETGANCVLVHAHQCVLCAIATSPHARPAVQQLPVLRPLPRAAVVAVLPAGPLGGTAAPAHSRAPPTV